MKKLLCILLSLPVFTKAQQTETPTSIIVQDTTIVEVVKSISTSSPQNIFKTNLFGLAISNYNLTYERKIGKKFTASFGFRYMPKSTLPFKSKVERFIDNPDLNINDFKLGNTAFTGELRWYAGKRAMRGFYIAPYFRYASFTATLPIDNPSNTSTETFSPILFDGKITSFSGGLMFGVQYNLSKKLVLDLWIVGAHYGSSKGIFTASNINPPIEDLTTAQAELETNLKNLDNIVPFSFDGKVLSPTSAEIKSSGPWAGIRAIALSLGYRF